MERAWLGDAPAFVARGDGPHVLLLAGLDEGDYSATSALLRVARELDRTDLAGSVTAIPQAAGVTPPAADAVLELRTAPPGRTAAPHARGRGELAMSLGLPRVESTRAVVSTLAGSAGRLEPAAVRALADAARNALRFLGVLPGPPVPASRRVDLVPVAASTSGWWVSAVRAGEEVHEGTLLGRVRDPWGDVVADVRSPCDGVVLVLTTRPPVGPGDELVAIAR